MPDLLTVLCRRWRLVLLLPLLATVVALVACLLLPKEYAGETTALPANAVVGDKARIFNPNIEALYPEIGSADELDKIEGTARLDTIYLAAVNRFNLVVHYNLTTTADAVQTATKGLKKKTEVKRTGYGELQIIVWDKDKRMAANLANFLLQELNDIHQHLQTENNRIVLERLKEVYAKNDDSILSTDNTPATATTLATTHNKAAITTEPLTGQRQHFRQLISEYELAISAAPRVLLVVEPAKTSLQQERPNLVRTLLFTFLASLLFSFLLALFVENRKEVV